MPHTPGWGALPILLQEGLYSWNVSSRKVSVHCQPLPTELTPLWDALVVPGYSIQKNRAGDRGAVLPEGRLSAPALRPAASPRRGRRRAPGPGDAQRPPRRGCAACTASAALCARQEEEEKEEGGREREREAGGGREAGGEGALRGSAANFPSAAQQEQPPVPRSVTPAPAQCRAHWAASRGVPRSPNNPVRQGADDFFRALYFLQRENKNHLSDSTGLIWKGFRGASGPAEMLPMDTGGVVCCMLRRGDCALFATIAALEAVPPVGLAGLLLSFGWSPTEDPHLFYNHHDRQTEM
ncbi:uncharacterized protein LOC131080868 [Melospiza georgiana]|uniref:uncharacterized protein LOC131080868 n=1 Tax=Melospiza georgiana TaxID=44398 RepID=UPI0025AD6F48|nr:uncharacterized protein LOC131080868 [Melospiza georgiana]